MVYLDRVILQLGVYLNCQQSLTLSWAHRNALIHPLQWSASSALRPPSTLLQQGAVYHALLEDTTSTRIHHAQHAVLEPHPFLTYSVGGCTQHPHAKLHPPVHHFHLLTISALEPQSATHAFQAPTHHPLDLPTAPPVSQDTTKTCKHRTSVKPALLARTTQAQPLLTSHRARPAAKERTLAQ